MEDHKNTSINENGEIHFAWLEARTEPALRQNYQLKRIQAQSPTNFKIDTY